MKLEYDRRIFRLRNWENLRSGSTFFLGVENFVWIVSATRPTFFAISEPQNQRFQVELFHRLTDFPALKL